MDTKEHFKIPGGRRRVFSEEFKRRKVNEMEAGLIKVSDICKEYQVTNTAVYKWKVKYSTHMKRKERLIIEAESDTALIKQLRDQIATLERIVGRDKVQIDYLNALIEAAEAKYSIDIKKNATD